MLTAVHVYNEQGAIVVLSLDDSSNYIVKNIEGLGPVKADIVTTEYVGMDGGIYQNAKGSVRNVVIQLGFNPTYESDDSFGELRRGLYPYFTPKMKVEMHFLNTNINMGIVKLIGYVESFEPSIFSAEPEVQISVLCPDPYFSSLSKITAFRYGEGSFSVTNPGVETGFILWITGDMGAGDLILNRLTPSEDTMKAIGGILGGQEDCVLEVITIKGSKSVRFFDQTTGALLTNTNLIGYIDGWIELLPGVNTFNIELPNSTINPHVYLSFTPRYAGL